MRESLIRHLLEKMHADSRIVLLTGDHGYAIFDPIKNTFPTRFINCGVAEQNMIGVAAGLSKMGFIPFAYGLSSFVPTRVVEQIKLSIALDKQKVILLGDGGGLVYSYLGSSHQSTEDLAIARCLPNLQVFSPADSHEICNSVNRALEYSGPSYVRIGKSHNEEIHKNSLEIERSDFEPLALVDNKRNRVTLLATGYLAHVALEIQSLYLPNINVYSCPFIKPINLKKFIQNIGEQDLIITLEEHSILAGFGSAVLESLGTRNIFSLLRIGVNDTFNDQVGSHDFLLKHHQLDAIGVVNQIRSFDIRAYNLAKAQN
jgi:transketolase